MKINFKKLVPHLIAIGVFLAVALIYCKPALQGKVLQQHDLVQWRGMSKDAENYKQKHGVYPLWTNGMFSGMPTFQIAYNGNNMVPAYVPEVLGLFLPQPILYFFLACICFYLLSQVLGVNPYIGIMGALAFAYATYDPVIIAVGHHTKMMTMALMPALLAGIILIFNKKYWLGAGLTALFSGAMVCQNHLQVIYYFFLVVAVFGIYSAIVWIKQKQYKHLLTAAFVSLASIGIGISSNAVSLLTTLDYAKATIRDGSALSNTNATGTATTQPIKKGLDSSYAMSYSLGIAEPLVLAVPRLFGGSSADPLPEGGKVYEVINENPGIEKSQLINSLSMYWGGIGGVGTSGPPYSGAIIVMLAIFGMFVLDNKYKWWIAASIAMAVLLSWGGYFWGLNGWLLKHLPLYDKFRAPSMIMVIPQLLLPLLAMLSLQKITTTHFSLASEKRKLKKGLIGVAGFAALLLLFVATSSFASANDAEAISYYKKQADPQTITIVKNLFNAMAADRRSVAWADLLRTLGFTAVAGLFIFGLIKKWFKPIVAIVGLTVFSFVDLIFIDVKYLNEDSYKENAEYDGKSVAPDLVPTQGNLAIQKDKGTYRVFDARQYKIVGGQQQGVSPFNDATQATHHFMVGGYHPAKLSIYQDLIENQISKGNQQVFNMLNTKYFLVNGTTTADSVIVNDKANGPAWFVKNIQYVKDARAEMTALDSINTLQTAVVQQAFKSQITNAPLWDSAATIQLANYDNNELEYNLSTATNGFAVLSEVYYQNGWVAKVDGKQTPIIKTDYVLRGISIPAGAKKLSLQFLPKSFVQGSLITTIASAIMLLVFAAGLFFSFKKKIKTHSTSNHS